MAYIHINYFKNNHLLKKTIPIRLIYSSKRSLEVNFTFPPLKNIFRGKLIYKTAGTLDNSPAAIRLFGPLQEIQCGTIATICTNLNAAAKPECRPPRLCETPTTRHDVVSRSQLAALG